MLTLKIIHTYCVFTVCSETYTLILSFVYLASLDLSGSPRGL